MNYIISGLQFWTFIFCLTLIAVWYRVDKRLEEEERAQKSRWEAHCSVCGWHAITPTQLDAWDLYRTHYKHNHDQELSA